MKQCCNCKLEKATSEFYREAGRSDGLRPECKTCTNKRNDKYRRSHLEKQREATRRWYHSDRNKGKARDRNHENYIRMQDRRKGLVNEAKRGGCIVCGESRVNCLVFHHLGDKDTEISKLRTAVAVIRELSKCVVVCSNCHLLIHAGDISLPSDTLPIDVTPLSDLGRDRRYVDPT